MNTAAQELDLLQERELFEENVYRAYFLSNIQRKSGGPFELQLSAATMDKSQFCERKPNGLYVFDDVNAAWWAWQERAKLAGKFAAEAPYLHLYKQAHRGAMSLIDDVESMVDGIARGEGVQHISAQEKCGHVRNTIQRRRRNCEVNPPTPAGEEQLSIKL